MTTTTVPVTIVCPDWCDSTPIEHAHNLWDMGGECVHSSRTIEVADPVGHLRAMDEPRYYSTIEVMFGTAARPDDGIETESAVFYIDGREHSVSQALALAEAIRAAVDTYRAAGGTS